MILKSELGMEGSVIANVYQEGKEELITNLLDKGVSVSKIVEASGFSKEHILSLRRSSK